MKRNPAQKGSYFRHVLKCLIALVMIAGVLWLVFKEINNQSVADKIVPARGNQGEIISEPDRPKASVNENTAHEEKSVQRSLSMETDINVSKGEKRKVVSDELKKQGLMDQKSSLSEDVKPLVIGAKTISRHRQVINDIEIFGAVVVLTEEAGRVIRVSGLSYPQIELDTQPGLTFEAAFAKANELENPPLVHLQDARLVVIEIHNKLYLAWQVSVQSTITEQLFIDAQTGSVLERFALDHSNKQRVIFNFAAACRRQGITGVTHIDNVNNVWKSLSNPDRVEGSPAVGDEGVDKLYDLMGLSYAHMQGLYGFDSFDNNGHPLLALGNVRFHQGLINCGGDQLNAMWNHHQKTLFVPDYMLPYSEVVFHEVAHGITSSGSNLVYAFEPGALNEAVSDILGITFKFWLLAGGSETNLIADFSPVADQWNLKDPSGIVRSMRDPLSAGHPDHYSVRKDWPKSQDNGGVHVNSSIINHAFYIQVTGGQHPRLSSGPDVKPIKLAEAARIYQLATAKFFTPRTNFEQARSALAIAAETLFGQGSPQWVSVHESLDAVGISGQWEKEVASVPNPAPKPAPAQISLPIPPSPAQPETSPSSPGKPVLVPMLAFALVAGVIGTVIYRNRATKPGERALQGAVPVPGTAPAAMILSLKSLQGSLDLSLPISQITSQEALVIGRNSELSHLVINDQQISRRHARIRLQGHRLTLEDLNSSSGTFINGQRITPFTPREIFDQDRISFADISFQVSA